ncbi:tRNA delta(2)-isopentenylpyrophosphate transferase [Methylophaga frappieri]|jgi:tRNA dimethylallyltransferase|uniref:tRNA dimethylallyltransferase n=1 Tax=Methylophaga frappieri (strain ATCC BAA-2434 / DSM 25690 / JAM7) TaxID=754477 RepID=I1YKW3_METFJ|nr:tRNA (adenosine(37)-N6)-dimethylallyltransferase MiaA [Methylophaga frappieri]AFJ03556.1 tRNA delta(2)-isopentenylpyrophosphate transferase [Methylophaga frappieri]
MALPPAILLMGPTASGKTELALAVAKTLPVEIISVDSALVYRGMDIGTAKPSLEERQQVPHHLIDILEPTEVYSVGQFRADALALMDAITVRGNIPMLVGGTMLYFNSLQRGLADLPPASPSIRRQLDQDVASAGLTSLHERLQQVDPDSASRIKPTDPQRLQRALEVYMLTGKPMSLLINETQNNLNHRLINLVLAPFNRSVLHERIARRYQKMLESGFLEEVRKLMARGDCHAALPSIRAVGYRQAWSCLRGDYAENELVEKAVIATRQMAKRQLTWCRSQRNAVWFDSSRDLPVAAVISYLQEQCADR